MEMMSKINSLLDRGYKMTNYSCAICGAVTFSLPGASTVHCPKCNSEYEPEAEEEDPTEDRELQGIQIYQSASKHSKGEDVSKKIGARLIQGWAMLSESCKECNVPLMRNKADEKICCACDRNFSIKSKPPLQKKDSRPRSRSNSISKDRAKSKTYVETIENRDRQAKKHPNSSAGSRIGGKAMEFLEDRLERAIEDNNLDTVERILKMAETAAGLINQ